MDTLTVGEVADMLAQYPRGCRVRLVVQNYDVDGYETYGANAMSVSQTSLDLNEVVISGRE